MQYLLSIPYVIFRLKEFYEKASILTLLIDFYSLSLSYDCPEWRKCAGSLLPLWSDIRPTGVPVSVYWLCRPLQRPFLFHLPRCQQLPRVLPDLCWVVGVKQLLHRPQFAYPEMGNRHTQVFSTWYILLYTWLELWPRFWSHEGVRACVSRCCMIREAAFPVECTDSNNLSVLVLAPMIKWCTWHEVLGELIPQENWKEELNLVNFNHVIFSKSRKIKPWCPGQTWVCFAGKVAGMLHVPVVSFWLAGTTQTHTPYFWILLRCSDLY